MPTTQAAETVGLAKGGHDFHSGAQIGLIAAEALRGQQPEHPGVDECGVHLVGQVALRVHLPRVLTQQRLQCDRPRHQLRTI
jgi:hypothetical protein